MVEQYKQNKSQKATQWTKACSTNYQQQNTIWPYQQAFQVTKNIKYLKVEYFKRRSFHVPNYK